MSEVTWNAEKILKDNLKRLREKKGITCYAMATELNMDKAYYYRIVDPKHHVQPRYDVLERIARNSGIEFYELFKPYGNETN